MRRIGHKLADETGVEILEVALVLPIVFMLLLGIVWFGRAFNIYSTITQAAQQGAITAARPTCATCGTPLTDAQVAAQVDVVVSGVIQSSHLDPLQILANPNPTPPLCTAPAQLPLGEPPGQCTTTTHNITVCRSAILNPPAGSTPPDQCGAVVSFQYPFQSNLPFTSLNLQRIILTAQAQTRMEN